MKILNFGSCNIDYVYSLDHIVVTGETETTHKLETFPGGKGLNQSVALAKAGAQVYHAGCVGKDGEMLTTLLQESGVDISYLQMVPEKNGHAIIQVSAEGDNSIFLYPGSNECITKEMIDSVLADFDAGDILLLQNEISNVDHAIEKGHEKGMQIVLNPSPFNQIIRDIDLNKISYLILNEVEAKEFSNCVEPEASLHFFRKQYPSLKVMLTLGSKGCVFMDETQELYQPIFLVDAVDTTAAGDTFTGYFVAGLSRGETYGQILRIASAASAISVSRNGAAPSIPDRREVENALPHLKENATRSKKDIFCRQINEYLEQNIQTASLTELAQLLGYSKFYTSNLVKKYTGQTFSKFLQTKRCSIAAQMLSDTDLSVEDIINSVGYENESFFRTIFKEYYGKKPLEFRRFSRGEKEK